MKRRATGVIFSILLLIGLCVGMGANAANEFVIKQVIPDKAGKLIIISGSGSQNFGYKTFRLSSPDRLVVDIDNTILSGPKKIIQINNENVTELKVAQFSTEPAQVRLVLTGDSAKAIKKIKVSKNKNTILLNLNKIVPVKIAQTPLYKDRDVSDTSEDNDSDRQEALSVPVNLNQYKNLDPREALLKSLQDKIDHSLVLKRIKHYDNRVVISGTGILSITEPMVLENPKRLVFDIPDSVINSDALLQPISLKNGDFLRIGQFKNNMVRIVLESRRPEQYKTIISPDMQSIVIAPENEVSFLEFPDSDSVGELQDIKVIKQDKKTTKILLTSARPLILNIKHLSSSDLLNLEIYNLKRPRKELITKLPNTEQFHGIYFENILRYPNGARWLFPLNQTAKVESKLSLDGRMLEITLKDVLSPMVCKSTSGRKIVLDAGHGGQEPGAMRAGIYEKDITIDVVQRVKSYLQQAGIKVVMTREGDESVSLKQRTVVTNDECPDAFVSVHVNSSENSGVTGLETYYYTPQSKDIAQSIHTKLVSNINSPDRGIRTARFYVIRNTPVPAILAEIGYLSNDGERNEILSDERKDATARAIADGIINYLKSRN